MSEAYKQAIEIITSEGCDLGLIAIRVAQEAPEVFVDAYFRDKWIEPCLDAMRSGNKIGAIKECRAKTGWTLKKAKDAVEEEMARNGWAS